MRSSTEKKEVERDGDIRDGRKERVKEVDGKVW